MIQKCHYCYNVTGVERWLKIWEKGGFFPQWIKDRWFKDYADAEDAFRDRLRAEGRIA